MKIKVRVFVTKSSTELSTDFSVDHGVTIEEQSRALLMWNRQILFKPTDNGCIVAWDGESISWLQMTRLTKDLVLVDKIMDHKRVFLLQDKTRWIFTTYQVGEQINYRILASRSTCYNSENQLFLFFKVSNTNMPHNVFLGTKHFYLWR